MNKKVALISGLVVVGLIGGALVFSNGEKEEAKGNNKEMVTIEHAVGTTKVEEEPERIVVFDYAALDAIQTLGVDGVVGVPQSSTIPEYLNEYAGSEYANIGGLKEPDLEKINELDPDLIIINGRQHSFYDKLSEIAPTISMGKEDGKYMESTTRNLNYLGDIFNKEEEVAKKFEEINAKIDEINKEVKDNKYVATTLMASDGELSVFGADSRFGMIYNELGFENTDENIQNADHGQGVSYEYIASQDTDFMFVIDKSVISSDKQSPAQELLNNDLVNSTKVAKEGNIVYLDTLAWYLADGGFKSTNTMLDEVKEAISK
ncbi:MAG: siderophore ABC transporter substrate-binding protein [Peptostreptococcaceae bacterium]